MACSQHADAVGFQDEADEFRPRCGDFERPCGMTLGVSATPKTISLARRFCDLFEREPVLGEARMPMDCVIC